MVIPLFPNLRPLLSNSFVFISVYSNPPIISLSSLSRLFLDLLLRYTCGVNTGMKSI